MRQSSKLKWGSEIQKERYPHTRKKVVAGNSEVDKATLTVVGQKVGREWETVGCNLPRDLCALGPLH
jgi:hypothetical protein